MQAMSVAENATSDIAFHPLRRPDVCDKHALGGAVIWNSSEWAIAQRWFKDKVAVHVLSLETSTKRREIIKARLDSLRIPFTFVDGVDMRREGELDVAKREGLIPADFNISRAQEEAFTVRNNMGSISGTVGCAAAHFRAQMYGVTHDPKDLTLILEDDVSPEEDFVAKLWRLVTKELPCDWQAVSLYSRCPFGECISPHLTRVHPDVNEPDWRCRHGVNYGFQGMVYRTSEIEDLQRMWKPVVFDESRPHCLDVDVALASISDTVRFYAVPAMQSPGLLHEMPEGSSRAEINWAKKVTSDMTDTLVMT